ncbi:MAG: hypothetical protein ACTS3R_18340 [Inquilinaceae bacterium]
MSRVAAFFVLLIAFAVCVPLLVLFGLIAMWLAAQAIALWTGLFGGETHVVIGPSAGWGLALAVFAAGWSLWLVVVAVGAFGRALNRDIGDDEVEDDRTGLGRALSAFPLIAALLLIGGGVAASYLTPRYVAGQGYAECTVLAPREGLFRRSVWVADGIVCADDPVLRGELERRLP